MALPGEPLTPHDGRIASAPAARAAGEAAPAVVQLAMDGRWWRRALVLGLTAYGVVCLRSPETFTLVDAVNLGIHETGHLVFAPLGELMHFLGGTLLQLCFPLLFVGHFLRLGDRFAAHIVLWWVAQNLWNVSVYVADARAMQLPLVGGGEHDWAYLLGRAGWLPHDQLLSALIHLAGVVVFAWAMLQAWHHSGDRSRGGAAVHPDVLTVEERCGR
jgi:hypothetical protein